MYKGVRGVCQCTEKLGFIAVEIIFGIPHPCASVSIRGEINIGFRA